MKKKLVLAMAATMAITSCAVPVFADDAAAEGGKIGISMPTQSLERWNRDGSYLEEQFKAAGFDVELTYSDNETDRQVNDIQNLISDGVNLLVVAAIDGEALNTVMDEAADAGIPVISYDRLIKSDAVSYYISFDNYTVGTLQGQYVVDTLDLDNAGDKTYNIEFTAGDPADNNAGYFFNGAFDVLKPYIDAGTLNVVSGQTDFDSVATAAWDTQTALERMQNILASYYAKRMGLPVGKLVCASNENNVLTDFLTTGTYTAKREFFKTTSPSMDILVSSNLERLLYHVTGSDAEVAGLMKSLAETGSYTVRPETLAAIQENFSCGWSSEEEVAGEIRVRYEKDNYLCDTHTAVAFHVAAQKKRAGVPMVVLSTASPFKFPRSVLEALGRTAPENDFEAMQQLEAATAHTAPASLAALRQKPERFNTVIDPAQIAEVALGYQE